MPAYAVADRQSQEWESIVPIRWASHGLSDDINPSLILNTVSITSNTINLLVTFAFSYFVDIFDSYTFYLGLCH